MEELLFTYQKNNVPPHLKRCGLIGTCFFDARERPHLKRCGFQRSRHKQKNREIKSHLEQFKNLSEELQFKEFLFCLLTPQSNAQRCWQAVEEISKFSNPNEENIFNILKSKTRFHKTKIKRILNAKEQWEIIKPRLNNQNTKELRNFLAENVNGYGLKEAGHFLRNIGLSNNKIAILDRHILRNLKALNIIQEDKIKNKKNYFELENAFLEFANKLNIPAEELDLLWWSKENGEIFK